MTLTYEEAKVLAEETARATGSNADIALELVRLGYVAAIEDALSASKELKVDAEPAKEKNFNGGLEVGKAIARRIFQDKLEALRRKSDLNA